MSDTPIVFSLGGSLVSPNGGIDTTFLSTFNTFIRSKIIEGKRFFIVVGGGATARHYRDAGKAVVGKITDADLDWLGIHATRLNAHLLRTIFQDIAHPRIIDNYSKRRENIDEPVVIAAGWKPGWSTDYCAVLLAKEYGCKTLVNMSNIQKVYTSDPKNDPSATPIDTISWEEFTKLVGNTWSPGSNLPFDPVASRLAKELKLRVYVLDGRNIENLNNALEDRPFVGTIIS